MKITRLLLHNYSKFDEYIEALEANNQSPNLRISSCEVQMRQVYDNDDNEIYKEEVIDQDSDKYLTVEQLKILLEKYYVSYIDWAALDVTESTSVVFVEDRNVWEIFEKMKIHEISIKYFFCTLHYVTL